MYFILLKTYLEKQKFMNIIFLYKLYIYYISIFINMKAVAKADFRKGMSDYLNNVKYNSQPLVIWSRNKKEFLVLPYPNIDKDSDLFEIYEKLEDKIIQNEYYQMLWDNMDNWIDSKHDNLFE